ncbi:MAG: D-tyrosyl-tRNA(Tyr) deacylase [Trueperaceae bacterium]|nr:MAG: D-tyrosyl-tRNA(Tyr) deacylase [Trueperaceae bacterium]
MRALIQRVAWARVRVEGEQVGAIEKGLLILLGVTHQDTTETAAKLAAKTRKLRIFSDQAGKMNLSVDDAGGSLLVVSQFTLYGDVRGGNRPSFTNAAKPESAEELYLAFIDNLKKSGLDVSQGRFGALMEIELLNEGPVTLWLDTEHF